MVSSTCCGRYATIRRRAGCKRDKQSQDGCAEGSGRLRNCLMDASNHQEAGLRTFFASLSIEVRTRQPPAVERRELNGFNNRRRQSAEVAPGSVDASLLATARQYRSRRWSGHHRDRPSVPRRKSTARTAGLPWPVSPAIVPRARAPPSAGETPADSCLALQTPSSGNHGSQRSGVHQARSTPGVQQVGQVHTFHVVPKPSADE